MISDQLIDFIEGPSALIMGTRDDKLQPYFSRPIGAKVTEDKQGITFFLQESQAESPLNNLKNNGQVALTIVQMPSHETYQFKGTYLSSWKSNESEHQFQENSLNRLADAFAPLGIPESYWKGFLHAPSIAVTFKVEKIFIQTPGPEAGKQLL